MAVIKSNLHISLRSSMTDNTEGASSMLTRAKGGGESERDLSQVLWSALRLG